MATTNEWYQRSVRDYEDKVRDYSADLAFLNEQIQTANNSIADLRRQRAAAAGNDEEVQQLTDTINNVTSRRNGLELRQADTQQALTQAESSLAQAQADLARVNQGAPAGTLPEQPPSAPAADPAARQAQAPITTQNNQVTAIRQPADVTDTGEIPGVTGSDRLQTDPGEVPGETVFGASFAADTGGVPTQQLRDVPTPVPAQQPEFDEFPETVNTNDTFAGNGYGFVYDEDGELIPADSAAAERIQSESAQPVDPFAFDEGSLEIPQDPQGFNESDLVTNPEPVDPFAFDEGSLEIPQDPQGFDEGVLDQAGKEVARDQFTLQQRNNTTTQGDWRVRIRLLPGASYLYKDSVNYLLQPLRDSDGVVFPYVPTITTNYVARYDPYELVHANYRGFFYKNSHVGEIQINGTFTAQDTAEATYLLAVIHFFRSCTKMFYGQDSEFRGSPPPLVELSGYGEFQHLFYHIYSQFPLP